MSRRLIWLTALAVAVLAIVILLLASMVNAPPAQAQSPTPAAQTSASNCVTCHEKETPGIVAQHNASKHSAEKVDCSVCHGAEHKSTSDAEKATMPTPETCAVCHKEQTQQYRDGKHSLAWAAMKAMPMIAHQPTTIGGSEGFKGCSGCHKIGEKGAEEIKAFTYGTASCDSCHTRHTFSVKEAKDPRACMTCHMGFDHPQWEMWSTSKHGVIWDMEGDTGRAPTCQDCHMQDGDHAVQTAWGFLALRVPEDDQAWWNDRVEILKALGVLDDKGNPTERLEAVKAAKVARLDKQEFDKIRAEEMATCQECHSASFVKAQFDAGDSIIKDADKLMAEAIRTVKGLYDDGLLKKPADWKYAPDLLQFYEAKSDIEQELWVMFLEHRMRTFQGAFHNNPDYMHWYGWAAMKESLQRIQDKAEEMRAAAKAQSK